MIRPSSIFVPCLLLAACSGAGGPPPAGPSPKEVVQGIRERAGLVLEHDAYGDSATRLVYLDQGWSPAESMWFYHADQGSVLMPYDTLIHLEEAGSDGLLLAPESLARLRFLPQHESPDNPDALPVGLARHGDQMGVTCAACHTAQINYHGTGMRIEGAPSLASFLDLVHGIRLALAATLSDEAKLARFVARTPGGGKGEGSREAVKKSLQDTLSWFESYETANRTSTVEGFGRMDALDRIANQCIRFTSDPKNSVEPSAPVNFPELWDAPRHDYVQWMGVSPNAGAGALGRNTGEVLGVFAHVDVKHYETELEAKKGYPSSAESNALVAMEESLRKLESPLWPEQILPPIDRALAARGESLYKASCASCHAILDRADPDRKVVAMVTGIDVVGTDPTTANNIVNAQAPSGILQGAIAPDGSKYGAVVPVLALVADLATRSVAAHPEAAVLAMANAKRAGLEKTDKQGNYTKATAQAPSADMMSYKARPLNGIWASAPYLHNGSVPTLYDLLLPPAQRPGKFSLGRREYDPKKVGYESGGEVPFVVDTAVKGNSNRGHEYGTTLPDADRWALVEYLKSL